MSRCTRARTRCARCASLGGAINFVTPSGRDAPLAAFSLDLGSFGFARAQAQRRRRQRTVGRLHHRLVPTRRRLSRPQRGHSFRGSGNIGYQITPDIETRFYLNGNSMRQRIPGAVTKFSALTSPQTAPPSTSPTTSSATSTTVRLANKTTRAFRRYDHRGRRIRGRPAPDASDLPVDRLQYEDYGAFGRVTDDRASAACATASSPASTCTTGGSTTGSSSTARGRKGALLSSSIDRWQEHRRLCRGFAVRAAERRRHRRHAIHPRDPQPAGPVPVQRRPVGATEFNLWSPRAGLLWDIDPTWQAFANVSRSAEIPSFGENSASQRRASLNDPAADARPPTRSARADGGPMSSGISALSRRYHRRVPVPDNRTRTATATSSTPTEPFHQGVEAALGVAVR